MKIKPIYLLSEIPNDDEGKAFVKQLKKYLNKDQWEVKVRGQHLKKGLDWRQYKYGQPLSCSTHLRLYVTIKKSKQYSQIVALQLRFKPPFLLQKSKGSL
jgi:hypothetical protein